MARQIGALAMGIIVALTAAGFAYALPHAMQSAAGLHTETGVPPGVKARPDDTSERTESRVLAKCIERKRRAGGSGSATAGAHCFPEGRRRVTSAMVTGPDHGLLIQGGASLLRGSPGPPRDGAWRGSRALRAP